MWFDPVQLAKAKPRAPATFATPATVQTQEPIQGPKVAIVAKVATHADILERHPEAIAAEPFNQAAPKPARSCSTCAHVCRSGCCGEPVAAGLSDLSGVIRYGNAAMCEAFEERAAIMEYDGGMTRDEAESQARTCNWVEKT